MNRFEDERLRFFMRHRDIIREWAAIEKDIPPEAHQFLVSLADDLDWIIEEHAPDAMPIVQVDQDFPKIFIARHAWGAEPTKKVKVAIGLEWVRKSVNLDTSRPYAGVWVDIKLDGGEELRKACGDSCGEIARQNGYRSTHYWPSLKEVPPPNEEFWEDLIPYREALLDSLIKAWELFSPCVDQVMDTGDW